MTALFKELDYRPTRMGALSLRRRCDPLTGVEIHEILLGDAFLMSSRFTASEVALAQLGLEGLAVDGLDVVVGGLGLGYTARTALDDRRVDHLLVVEAMPEVIEWHREGLLPLGAGLTGDPRCRIVQADFFACAASGEGFDPDRPGRRHDAVIVDIDHAPDNLLHPSHATFYTHDGLGRLARHIRPGGILALWSNDAPDLAFEAVLAGVFDDVRARSVTFEDLNGDVRVSNTVYLARRRPA